MNDFGCNLILFPYKPLISSFAESKISIIFALELLRKGARVV